MQKRLLMYVLGKFYYTFCKKSERRNCCLSPYEWNALYLCSSKKVLDPPHLGRFVTRRKRPAPPIQTKKIVSNSIYCYCCFLCV